MHKHTHWSLVLSLLTLVAASPRPAAAGPDANLTADGTILLEGAIVRANGTTADLEIYPTCVNGEVSRDVLGWSLFLDIENQKLAWTAKATPRSYNAMDHEGTITRSAMESGLITLTVKMKINADPWVPGGAGEYAIEMKRDGDNLSGAFTGTYQDKPVKGVAKGSLRKGQWPAPVAGYVPLKPGEHPRMLFRAADVPGLREKAKTPEGKAMLARLEEELKGPFTVWHACGFALLYQVTGDKRFAEESKKFVEMARGGTRQKDSRYSYASPGGKLRAGPSYAGIAEAYDMCYDAWDGDYRKTLAREIQEKVVSTTGKTDLLLNTGGGQHHPQSNHHMAWNGGGGAAIIAVLGDPGVDSAAALRAERIFEQRGKRSLLLGHGDGGYFFEGHHCGRLNNNTGFFEFIQAMRVALGRDLIAGSDSGQYLMTKMLYEICRYGGNLESLQRGMYARDFGRTGMSSGGDFAHGLGACPEAAKPAVLYFCNHLLDPPGAQRYDIMSFPHRGVYAFVNWPLGLKERNPAETMPHFLHDRRANYVVLRSSWKGDEDIILSMRWGEGLAAGAGLSKGKFRSIDGKISKVEQSADGTMVSIDAPEQACLVDFSGKSGAPVVIVTAKKQQQAGATGDASPEPVKSAPLPKPKKGDDDEPEEAVAKAGDTPKAEPARLHTGGKWVNGYSMTLVIIKPGAAPKIDVAGKGAEQRLTVGGQTYGYDGKAIQAAK
jgi:hypothetical protein